MKKFFIPLFVAATVLAFSCPAFAVHDLPVIHDSQSSGSTEAVPDLKVRQPTPSEIDKVVTCTVMNAQFPVNKNTPVIDYKGKPYYFCCSPCVEEFKKNPDKYAK